MPVAFCKAGGARRSQPNFQQKIMGGISPLIAPGAGKAGRLGLLSPRSPIINVN